MENKSLFTPRALLILLIGAFVGTGVAVTMVPVGPLAGASSGTLAFFTVVGTLDRLVA